MTKPAIAFVSLVPAALPVRALALAFLLAACGSQTPGESGGEADAFAARIEGAKSAATAAPAPAPAAVPLPDGMPDGMPGGMPGGAPGGATGAFAPGTATDPEATTCNAPAMAPYLGTLADAATRAEIMQVIGGANVVRFVPAGSPTINPDPTNPRLNLMLDRQDIIRDARCG